MAAGPSDDAPATGATEPRSASPATPPRGRHVDELARVRRRRTEDLGVPPGAGSGLDVRPLDLHARLALAAEELSAERDAAAEIRDYDALRRDQAADMRDRVMSQRELSDAHYDGARGAGAVEALASAAATAARASAHRADSLRLRELAAADRAAAASDRLLAARDRSRALVDRAALLCELERSRGETLSWVRSAEPCLSDIEYELRRCRRVASSLVVACIDILAAAGERSVAQADEQQRHTIARVREHLRATDLLVAHRADRYVCAMPDLSLAAAGRRIAAIQRALADDPDARPICVGIARPREAEDAVDAITRANDLIRRRHDRR